jgi:tetratricopeptide (TPR) repeat protein
LPLWAFSALLLATPVCPAAETNVAAPRLTVAILTFEDQTAAREAAHWRYSLSQMLQAQLRVVNSIRLRPRGAVDFAHRHLEIDPGEAISPAQARQMGELIEAHRTVWGTYRRDGDQWSIRARVMNVASGQPSSEIKAASTNWFDARDLLLPQLLAELGVKPSAAERQQMLRRPTLSPEAWENFSQAYALQVQGKPWPEQEVHLRKALELDPRFAEAHMAQGAILCNQGKFAAGEEALRQALQIKPDLALARLSLGSAFLTQEKFAEAETELRQAQRLEPDDAQAVSRLGEVSFARGHVEEAIALWNQARRLDPTDATIHAQLGKACAGQGQRTTALAELREAERLAPENPEAEAMLCMGYDALHDTAAALAHAEKFVALMRKRGGNPALVQKFEERAGDLKATLTPQAVAAKAPKTYTEAGLEAALRERITEEEFKLVTNPLASNQDMKRVAKTITLGLQDDLEKARKLFEALARHLDPGTGGARTAQQIFAAWNDPHASFLCQEYARFYVALARDAGLQAFFTLVDKDCQGRRVTHACACVFADNKAWLVDPSYRWFGVPHQEFSVLDDLQAVAVYLHQQHRDLPRLRLAVKLQPNSALAQFNLAMNLMSDHRLNEARLVLDTALRLEPDSWLAHSAQGYLAGWSGQWAEAERQLRQAKDLNPDSGKARLFLAESLRNQGKLKEAREEYRAALSLDLEPQFCEGVRRTVAQINEKLGTD